MSTRAAARGSTDPKRRVHRRSSTSCRRLSRRRSCGSLASTARSTLAQLARDNRRRLSHALVEWPLPVDRHARLQLRGSDGRRRRPDRDRPGDDGVARLPGTVPASARSLDVDGRIGGFNFQWAWSSGFVAGRALAALLSSPWRTTGNRGAGVVFLEILRSGKRLPTPSRTIRRALRREPVPARGRCGGRAQ